jgi:hypothetical protein
MRIIGSVASIAAALLCCGGCATKVQNPTAPEVEGSCRCGQRPLIFALTLALGRATDSDSTEDAKPILQSPQAAATDCFAIPYAWTTDTVNCSFLKGFYSALDQRNGTLTRTDVQHTLSKNERASVSSSCPAERSVANDENFMSRWQSFWSSHSSDITCGLSAGVLVLAVAALWRYFNLRRRSNSRLGLTEYQLAAFAFFFLFVGRWIFSTIPKEAIPTFTGALVFSIFVTQALEIIRHKKLGDHIVSLERAVKSAESFQFVDKCLDSFDDIAEIVKSHPRLEVHMKSRLHDQLVSTNNVLSALGCGRLKFDETLELSANKEFLERLVEKGRDAEPEVLAVSYEDENFWTKPQGRDFLQANRDAISRGIKIERIFLVATKDKAAEKDFKAIIEAQLKAGVACLLVFTDEMEDRSYCEDFVIYCNRYVRFAELTDIRDNLKQATLSCELEDVSGYIRHYRYLRARATDAAALYKSKAESNS